MRTHIIALLGIAAVASAAHAQTPREQQAIARDFERRVIVALEQFECPSSKGMRSDVIFTLPIAMVFRQYIASALGEPSAPTMSAPRPGDQPHPAVCDEFPFAESAALPEAAAAALPALPAPLEYRLLGHDLVVRDSRRNLVFAVLSDAIRHSTRLTQAR